MKTIIKLISALIFATMLGCSTVKKPCLEETYVQTTKCTWYHGYCIYEEPVMMKICTEYGEQLDNENRDSK